MRGRNRIPANRPRPMRRCTICSSMVRADRMNAHMSRAHVPRVETIVTNRRRRNPRNNRNRRPRYDNITGQVMQMDQNLPVPARLTPRRAYGPRSAISNTVDTYLDKVLTPSGADFVHRSCHPNDDARGGGVFIPDDTTADRAIVESRPYAVVQAPSDITGNWDVMLCVLSTSDVPFVWRYRNSGEKAWSSWIVPQSDNYVQHGLVRGATPTPTGTAPQYNQQALWQKTPTLLNDSTQFRQAFKGITVVMNCASLTDQGYVTAGQWGNKAQTASITPTNSDWQGTNDIPGGFENNVYLKTDCLVYNEIPVEMSDIISACPEYGQWEAKKGIYMPMRYDDPVHEFNGGAESKLPNFIEAVSALEEKSGHPIMLVDITTDALENLRFNVSGVFTDKTNNLIATTAGDINQTFGCALFTGIDKTSQLILKCRLGLDLVPAPRSAFAAMAKKGPIKDQLALDMATSIQAKLPVVYEHKYNSLSMIVPWLAKAAMSVLPTLAPWIGNKVTSGIDWLGRKVFGTGVPVV